MERCYLSCAVLTETFSQQFPQLVTSCSAVFCFVFFCFPQKLYEYGAVMVQYTKATKNAVLFSNGEIPMGNVQSPHSWNIQLVSYVQFLAQGERHNVTNSSNVYGLIFYYFIC
jgi:hypothetical protein